MLPFIEKKFDGLNSIYQDDNAPSHRHKNVRNWIEKNKLNQLEWPPQSLDLINRENLWHFLELKVAKHEPKNQQELISVVRRVQGFEINDDLVQCPNDQKY